MSDVLLALGIVIVLLAVYIACLYVAYRLYGDGQ